MATYEREEKLKLTHKVYITKEVYEILKEQKKKQKISKAKITCNLILKAYEKY